MVVNYAFGALGAIYAGSFAYLYLRCKDRLAFGKYFSNHVLLFAPLNFLFTFFIRGQKSSVYDARSVPGLEKIKENYEVIRAEAKVLLNTGVMWTLGKERPPNLTVVVMDNGIYENIGGPPTHTSSNTDLARMAEGAGCLNCVTVRDADEFDRQFRRMLDDDQMGYLVAKIEPFAKHKWEWKDRKATDGEILVMHEGDVMCVIE